MDAAEPLKYIEKVVLEIVDRRRLCFRRWRVQRIRAFNMAKFNSREAAYAFLRQHNGEPFVKAQKIKVWCNNQELRLRVRDLIYGNANAKSNSMVEFIYRRIVFSEIKWPVTTAYRTNRVRWAHDYQDSTTRVETPEIRVNGVRSPYRFEEIVDVDLRTVPCKSPTDDHGDDQSLSVHSMEENGNNPLCRNCHFRRSVSGPGRLTSADDGAPVFEHTNDDENHFRSSIYVHVNRMQL